MKTLILAGGKRLGVETAKIALAQSDLELAILPNRLDSGKDDWQPSLLRFAQDNDVARINEGSIADYPGVTVLSAESDRIFQVDSDLSRKWYNLHFSLLPRHRGVYCSTFPLLAGDQKTGVTLHEMDAGIDTGPIVAQSAFPIDPSTTSRELFETIQDSGIQLIREWLPRLIDGDTPTTPQPVLGATYNNRRDFDFQSPINTEGTAWQIHNRIRARIFPPFQRPIVDGMEVTRSTLLGGPGHGTTGKARILGDPSGRILIAQDGRLLLHGADPEYAEDIQ